MCDTVSVWYSIKKASRASKEHQKILLFFEKNLDFLLKIVYTIVAERSATSGVSPPISEKL
jgi:hypothetical protein